MTLKELLDQPGITAAALARDVGCHRSYITRAAATGKISPAAAIKIWRARKVKIEPIADATTAEIKVLERLGRQSRAA